MTTATNEIEPIGCRNVLHRTMRTREERFLEKLPKPDCVIWCGARNSWGYGTFMWEHDAAGQGKNINASRAAWLLERGEIPQGQDVLHTCDNRLCVNVAHMYLGNDFDNARDRVAAGSVPKGEKSWNAKLNDEAVRAIRAEYRYERLGRGSKSNAKELAAKYGVGVGMITGVVRRRYWAHIA